MKKFERAHTSKGVISPEILKSLNINAGPLVFLSEPFSLSGTPNSSNRRKLILDPLTRDILATKKPTIYSLSLESTPAAKTTQNTIGDSNNKAPEFTKNTSDFNSELSKLARTGLKSHRRSRFASSNSTEQKQIDENRATFRTLNANETSKDLSSTITDQKESKQTSFKASESILKARDSPFQRKGFRVMTNSALSDYSSDRETKRFRVSREEPVVPYRSLYFSPAFNYEKFKKHLITVHKGLVYSTQSLKSPSEKFISSKEIVIPDPPIKKLKTLVLDLDETLVHTCSLKDSPDVILQTADNPSESMKIPLKVRPYLRDFFNKVCPIFEIIIFTASSAPYAKAVVNHIDPDRKFINFMLTREHCMETKNGFFIKDLRILKNRDLKDIIIVDNLAHSFGFQIENGVPILEFINDVSDMELRYLADYLLKGHYYPDLRDYNRENLRLMEMSQKKLEEIESEFKF